MKRSWKAFLSLLLAGAISTSMAACRTNTPPAESGASSGFQTNAQSSGEGQDTNMVTNEQPLTTATSGADSSAATTGANNPAGKPDGKTTKTNSAATRRPTAETPSTNYPVVVAAAQQSVDIIREDSDAKRRLVYLKLTNNEKVTRKNCVLTYVEDGKSSTRELSTIYLNEKIVYDTIWLKSGTTAVSAVLRDADGEELWKGTITVSKAKTERVIKKSTVYNNATLKPGTVRGVNYYPRQTPWSAWTSQSPSTWDSEFKEISSKLNVNAIRTFAECWETDQMLGGCATTEYLATIDQLFEAANKYGIHVLFCLYSSTPFENMTKNYRYVRSIVEPFINDGRVLAWDLINEVDDKGLSEVDYVDEFCLTMYPKLSQFDPNHTNQIGFAFMLDKATKIGLTFTGKNQSWQYHYYRKTSAENISQWVSMYFHDTPFFLGECGDTSALKVADGAPREFLGEDWQLAVYKTLIDAFNGAVANGNKMIGMFPWICYDFPTMANHVTGQGEFGLIRADGSLKPAGEYLAAEYAKIKKSRHAQWDK